MILHVDEMEEVYALRLDVLQEAINTYRRDNDYGSIADAVVPTRGKNADAVNQLLENGDIALTKKKIPWHIVTEQAYQLTEQGVETVENLQREGRLV